MNEEHLNTKVKDLILPRIGYLFAFVDDYNRCRKKGEDYTAKEGYVSANVNEVYQKIVDHIFENVGHLTVKHAPEMVIPDYKYTLCFDAGDMEENYMFNFFITWDGDHNHIEIEYDGCTKAE